MAQFSQDEAEASYDRQRVAQPSTRRQNGAPDQLTSNPIFTQQITAMQELVSRIYGMADKVRVAADLINGERPADKGSDQVNPNPTTVEQAWQLVCTEIDLLDNQINRLYT